MQTKERASAHRLLCRVAASASIAALSVALCTARASAQAPGTDSTLAISGDSTEVTHVVRRGDTLWDLANAYLKDPYRWPEIFRINTGVVANPHWIYPGEVLRIPLSELRPDVAGRMSGSSSVIAQIRTRPNPLTVFAPSQTSTRQAAGQQSFDRFGAPGVRAGEIESAPYVDRIGGPAHGSILAAVDRPGIETSAKDARYQLNDLVYVSAPSGTARLGDRYLAYRLGHEIRGLGQLVIPTAILQVENLVPGQPAVARVIRQFAEIRLRQGLIAAPNAVSVTRNPLPYANGLSGKILYIAEDPELASIQHYVILSPTSSSAVGVGDEFTLIDDTMGRSDPTPAPAVSAATAQVVKVTPYATTALILTQAQPSIREGMPVRLTAKMP